ncbi:MAG: hypothetical protein FE047_02570 [Thermoplasmata archaeon]|nr:MAG: hypothetical protein FE047_02570 [Thermoplasmata archaeon]
MYQLMRAILLCVILFSLSVNIPAERKMEIKVAIYFSNVKRFAEEIRDAIDYSWIKKGVKYVISAEIIGREDVKKGKLNSYDVFVIPGSARPYTDAMNKKWREEVIKFVENGGGYIGICGGANLASVGFDEGGNKALNPFLLKIANVYVNDEQYEEWQYLWKSNWRHGGPPIKLSILHTNNPIFEGFYGEQRSIRYWGGPGMYEAKEENEKFGEIIPLAIYAEEPMEVAPLHYWRWDGKWIPYRNVTTDIKGQYAIVATTYGKGRIVLFGPHPERETFFDGHIEEFPVRPEFSPFTWFIYNWVSDNKSTISYNWWILRRSIAWTVGIAMPPASETAVHIEEPRYGIYVEGRKILYSQSAIVIGKTNIIGKAINIRESYLYVDNHLLYTGKGDIQLSTSFNPGKHVVSMVGRSEGEEVKNEISIFVLK